MSEPTPETKPAPKRRCDRCEYYLQHSGESNGQCRFNPPQLFANRQAQFPDVGASTWCGHFEEREVGAVVPTKEKYIKPAPAYMKAAQAAKKPA